MGHWSRSARSHIALQTILRNCGLSAVCKRAEKSWRRRFFKLSFGLGRRRKSHRIVNGRSLRIGKQFGFSSLLPNGKHLRNPEAGHGHDDYGCRHSKRRHPATDVALRMSWTV